MPFYSSVQDIQDIQPTQQLTAYDQLSKQYDSQKTKLLLTLETNRKKLYTQYLGYLQAIHSSWSSPTYLNAIDKKINTDIKLAERQSSLNNKFNIFTAPFDTVTIKYGQDRTRKEIQIDGKKQNLTKPDVLEKYYNALQRLLIEYFTNLDKLDKTYQSQYEQIAGQPSPVKSVINFVKALRVLTCKYGMSMESIKNWVSTNNLSIPKKQEFKFNSTEEDQILKGYKNAYYENLQTFPIKQTTQKKLSDGEIRAIFDNPDTEYDGLIKTLGTIDGLRQQDRKMIEYCKCEGPQSHRRIPLHPKIPLTVQISRRDKQIKIKSKFKTEMQTFLNKQYPKSFVINDDATFVEYRPLYEHLQKVLADDYSTEQQDLFKQCMEKIASFYHLLQCIVGKYGGDSIFSKIIDQHSDIFNNEGIHMKFKSIEPNTVILTLTLHPSREIKTLEIKMENKTGKCVIQFTDVTTSVQQSSSSTSTTASTTTSTTASTTAPTTTSTASTEQVKPQEPIHLTMNEFYKYLCRLGTVVNGIHKDVWTPFLDQVEHSSIITQKYPRLRHIVEKRLTKAARRKSEFTPIDQKKSPTWLSWLFGEKQESDQDILKKLNERFVEKIKVDQQQLIKQLQLQLKQGQIRLQVHQQGKGTCGTPILCGDPIQDRIKTAFLHDKPDIDVVDILCDMKLWWMIRFFVPPLFMTTINKHMSVDKNGWITMNLTSTSFSVLFNGNGILDAANQYKVNGKPVDDINQFKNAVLSSIDQWKYLRSASDIFIQYMEYIIELYSELINIREKKQSWFKWLTGNHSNPFTSLDKFREMIKSKANELLEKIQTSSMTDVCTLLRYIEQYFYDSVETLFEGASFTTTSIPTKPTKSPQQQQKSTTKTPLLQPTKTDDDKAKKRAYFIKNFGPYVLEQSGKGKNIKAILTSIQHFVDVLSKKKVKLNNQYSS
jgi:hypothetical protein